MCAHFLKFVCFFVVMFACEGRPAFGEPKSLTSRPNCGLSDHKSSHDWDYLQFVVQWPQSFCLHFNRYKKKRGKRCIIPRNIRNWTIHGTWPTKTGTAKPQNCYPSWTFNLTEISDLLPEMNQSWPNLLTGGALGTFWRHEWDAHGTCCANLPALCGEHNYFSKTMDFIHKFDIDKALSVAGIVPSLSAKYKLADIRQALQNATGVTPNIQCASLKMKTGGYQHYLAEVRLCMNKTLVPRNCPVSRDNFGSSYLAGCSNDAEITLPPIP